MQIIPLTDTDGDIQYYNFHYALRFYKTRQGLTEILFTRPFDDYDNKEIQVTESPKAIIQKLNRAAKAASAAEPVATKSNQ